MIGPGNRLAHAAALAVAGVARRRLQPAFSPRPARARQDAPARGDRRIPTPRPPGARDPLHDRGAVHDRVRRRPAPRGTRGVQGPLPRARRAADRRRPGARGQAGDRGGVRPHLQHPARGRQADRPLERSPARGALEARRAVARPLRLGSASRTGGARPAHPDRGPLAPRFRRRRATRSARPAGDRRECAREHPGARGRDDQGDGDRVAAQRAAQLTAGRAARWDARRTRRRPRNRPP